MKTVLVGVGAIAVALVVGVGLGWLSWLVMVLGLFILAVGLAVGIAMSGLMLATGTLESRTAPLIAVVAVLVAWGAMQVIEDGHLVRGQVAADAKRAWTNKPEVRAAFKDADDPLLLELVHNAAEANLHAEIVAQTGADDLPHRWWYRAQSGVRLAGPWVGSRGIPVGPVGAAIWAVLEITLTTLLALTVVRRTRRRLRAATP